MESDKLFGALVKFVVIVVVIRFVVFGGLFDSGVYKGEGYSFMPPAGWKKIKEKKNMRAMMDSKEKPDVVTFVTPETVVEEGIELPAAAISVLVVKLSAPTWMEDEFPSLVKELARAGYKIIDKGQIEISAQVFHWVFYQDPQTYWVNLEFYMVNDVNKLFKVQFTSSPEAFKTYRPDFEKSRDTIKISTALW